MICPYCGSPIDLEDAMICDEEGCEQKCCSFCAWLDEEGNNRCPECNGLAEPMPEEGIED
jgi:hypothetical protein